MAQIHKSLSWKLEEVDQKPPLRGIRPDRPKSLLLRDTNILKLNFVVRIKDYFAKENSGNTHANR